MSHVVESSSRWLTPWALLFRSFARVMFVADRSTSSSRPHHPSSQFNSSCSFSIAFIVAIHSSNKRPIKQH
eukprot:scaffold528_cov165-Amphora_coffeaeformis.AAC.33